MSIIEQEWTGVLLRLWIQPKTAIILYHIHIHILCPWLKLNRAKPLVL